MLDRGTLQGSARTEGGREAPALGGGAGAARAASAPGGTMLYRPYLLGGRTGLGTPTASQRLSKGKGRGRVGASGGGGRHG